MHLPINLLIVYHMHTQEHAHTQEKRKTKKDLGITATIDKMKYNNDRIKMQISFKC